MSSTYYGKVRAQGYDIGTDVQKVASYYLNLWGELGKPSPVLEPMCGTGLNLLPFVEAGATIDGLDSSSHMLALCRQKLLEQGYSAELYEQPLEAMALPQQYGFMFIPDRSFGHLHDKTEAQSALKRMWEHLTPGGWLVLDLKHPAQADGFGKPGQADFGIEDRPDGSTIFSTSVWSEEGRIVRCWTKYEQYRGDKLISTEIFDYRERMYEHDEFAAMLKAAGFGSIKMTKAFADTEPLENEDVVYICQKA